VLVLLAWDFAQNSQWGPALLAGLALVPVTRFVALLGLEILLGWRVATYWPYGLSPWWWGGAASALLAWEIGRCYRAVGGLRSHRNRKTPVSPSSWVRQGYDRALNKYAGGRLDNFPVSVAREANTEPPPYPEYDRDTRLLLWYEISPSGFLGWSFLLGFVVLGLYVMGVGLHPIQIALVVGVFLVVALLDVRMTQFVEAPAHLAAARVSDAVDIVLFRPFRPQGTKLTPSSLIPAVSRCGRVWTAFSADYPDPVSDRVAQNAHSSIGVPATPVKFLAAGDTFTRGSAETWKSAIELRLEVCDLVIIDLSVPSRNVDWELNLACSRIPPGRVITVVDEQAALDNLESYYGLGDPGGSGLSVPIRFGLGPISRLRFAWVLRRIILRALRSSPSLPASIQLDAIAENGGHSSHEDRKELLAFLEKVESGFRLGKETAAWCCRRAILDGSLVALDRLGLGSDERWKRGHDAPIR
jgi:hypothetical protein